MIILKSDYSPKSAAEKQEADNVKMMHALLILAGLSKEMLDKYNDHSMQAAALYGAEIDIEDASKLTDEHWAAAQKAAANDLEKACNILKANKITIKNKLVKSDSDSFYSHIETAVFKGHKAIARIERPIIDIDAETYQDNHLGWGGDEDVWPVPFEAGMTPLNTEQKTAVSAAVSNAIEKIGHE